jgi:protein LSM14
VQESQVPLKSQSEFVAESHALPSAPERQQAPPTRPNAGEKKAQQTAPSEQTNGHTQVSKPAMGRELNIQLKLKSGGSRTDSEEKSAAPSFALPPKPVNATAHDNRGQSLTSRPDKTRNGHGNTTTSGNNGNNNRTGPPRPKMTIPDSEFDFESSNAKFDKSSVLQDNSQSTEASYKKSSFFDDISCEVKDRMESRAYAN